MAVNKLKNSYEKKNASNLSMIRVLRFPLWTACPLLVTTVIQVMNQRICPAVFKPRELCVPAVSEFIAQDCHQLCGPSSPM